MQREIPGYEFLDLRYEIRGFSIYRIRHGQTGVEFLAKAPSRDFPPVAEVRRLEHELAVLQSRREQLDGVLMPVQFIDSDRNSYLLLESFDGVQLSVNPRHWNPHELWELARRLFTALADCHDCGIVHRALIPDCILWDEKKQELKIAHFVHATAAPRIGAWNASDICVFSAPEQTGQMTVTPDHRADLYSAGAVLYYLATRRAPFDVAEASAELVHRLLATQPSPVEEGARELPKAFSELIAKLLAKNPDDRPNNARDVLAMLELVQRKLVSSEDTTTIEVPALRAPRLQGRAHEIEQFTALAAGVASGASTIVCLAGEPGSGKSRLVLEFRRAVDRDGFLFISGKFEQYRHQRPYSALLSAVEGFLDRILAAPEEELAYWKGRLRAIAPTLQAVLAELLPNLRGLVSAPEEPQRLGPAETKNRFHTAFRAFLEALCDRAHPLVLVIDDLQWADDETTALLTELFVKNGPAFSMLIVSYRPQEGNFSPSVQEFIHKDLGETAHTLELLPLPMQDIAAICSDLVDASPDLAELVRVVERGCKGNALFALEIVKRLRAEGSLSWSVGDDGVFAWRLEPHSIDDSVVPENVVDFIVSRIHVLPAEVRRTLIVGSVIGHSFLAAELAVGVGAPPLELVRPLRAALAEGLIVPANTPARNLTSLEDGAELAQASFSFVHDRVQQAAYSLCSEEERLVLHYRLGQAIRARASQDRDALFAAVEHLNHVSATLEDGERTALGRLNIAAGKAAKEAVAYRTASTLFETALGLFTTQVSKATDPARFEAHLLLAESLYLNSAFERAETAFEAALACARNTDEEVEVHRTRLVLYQHQQRYAEAVTLGLRALSLLGLVMPEKPSRPRLMAALVTAMVRTARQSPASLLDRPDRANATERKVLDILVLLWTAAFWVNQNLNALIVLELLEMISKLGNTAQAPMAYVCFGIFNHALFKNHLRGFEFGQLAMRLLPQNDDPFIESRVRFLALTYFGPFERENSANVAEYQDALNRCLLTGEHVFAGHTIDGIATSLPVHSFRLDEVERRLDACMTAAEQIGSRSSSELVRVIRAWCKALSLGPEGEWVIHEKDIQFESYVGVHRMLHMATSYLWENDAEVLRLAKVLRGNNVIQGNPLHASFYALFHALSLCRTKGKRAHRTATRALQPLSRFAAIFPPNFQSMLLLGEAEVARSGGYHALALDRYHRAILEATTRGHDLIHALSCERLAGYYESLSDSQQHVEYLSVAAYAYDRFGATAKVVQLARKYPTIEFSRSASVESIATSKGVDLGVEAVLRAAYAIAEETRSDELAKNLLRVIATSAGAQRAFLLRPSSSSMDVVARFDAENATQDRPGRGERVELVSQSIVRYVARTMSVVHLSDALKRDARFSNDAYLEEKRPRSLLCLPLMHRGNLLAILYLENSICADVFTEEQKRLSIMLGHQAAITLATADYHKVQIDVLQARINPHFLHNTLSVIAQLIISDAEKAEVAVLKLSKLYRYVQNSSADQLVSLEQELGIVREYLALEQFRYGERLQVEFVVEGPVQRVQVPALLLQPLAENAVRYGVGRKVGVCHVCIEVTTDSKQCTMRVRDDGPGWHDGPGGTGFGLRSVRDRLALLYAGQFELNIEKSNGVSVEITIPTTGTQASVRGLRHALPELAPRQHDDA